jgi:hypothetical protein
MGRQIPNHRFSREKDREVSSFESALDSIRRRISNSGTRRRSRIELVTERSQVDRFSFEDIPRNTLICWLVENVFEYAKTRG